jgi:hypothetical protein
MKQGWIGVDLDGTLAHYDKWVSKTHIGAPIAPMVERVKQWLREDVTVKIFTARVTSWDRSIDPEVEMAVRSWCDLHIGEKLEVTNIKDMEMIELWDDRCVQVAPNTGEPVTYWQSRL